jgi:hypothetical protein
VRNFTGMAPRDLWDLNLVFQTEFHYSYIENVLMEGMGYPDPYPVYDSLVDKEWIDNGDANSNMSYETESYMLTESESDDDSKEEEVEEEDEVYNAFMQDVLDFVDKYKPGTILNPIDLTEED